MLKKLLFAMFLLLVPARSFASVTVVTADGRATVDHNTVTTIGVNTTTATAIIIATHQYNGNCTPTDNKGNTYTALTRQFQGSGFSSVRLWYKQNAAVGPSHTVTCTETATFPVINMIAIKADGSGSLLPDQENGATGTGGTLATGSITPLFNGEIVLSAVTFQGTGASIDSGFTEASEVAYVGGTNVGGTLAYKIQTTAAAVNPTWTAGAFSTAATIASFRNSSDIACAGTSPAYAAADFNGLLACMSVAVNHDVVTLAAGTTSGFTLLTVPAGVTIKGPDCTLDGQGQPSATNSCTAKITDDTNGELIDMTLENGKVTRLSSIEVSSGTRASGFPFVIHGTTTTTGRFRLDHMRILDIGGSNWFPWIDQANGVIDHNYYRDPGTTGLRQFMNMHNAVATDLSDVLWAASANFGMLGGDARVYIEDNEFARPNATVDYAIIDGFSGEAYTFRYNQCNHCIVDTHGTDTAGRSRGLRSIEVYGNNLNGSGGIPVFNRSGPTRVWNNTNTGYVASNALLLNNERSAAPLLYGIADGHSIWDVNPGAPIAGGGPFTITNCTLSTDTMVACVPVSGPGAGSTFKITKTAAGWTPHAFQYYNLHKIGCNSNNSPCGGVITDNDATTITFFVFFGTFDIPTLNSGDQIEINQVTHVFDGSCRGMGTQLEPKRSVEAASNSGSTVTITLTSHGFTANVTYVMLAEMGPGEYNGTYLVTEVLDANRFRIVLPASPTGAPSSLGNATKVPVSNDQITEGCYQWLNTVDGVNSLTSPSWYPHTIRENELYFDYGGTVQSSSSTPFNGTLQLGNAVGVGIIARRPSTCSSGAFYWALDQGEWNSLNGATPDGKGYRCVSSAWVDDYNPYTYPHPLVTGTPSITSAIPSNGTQGATNESVTITGANTAWMNGSSNASFGAGITVNSTTCSGVAICVADITISSMATPGTRNVTITTGMVVETMTDGFTVIALNPAANVGGRLRLTLRP